MPRAAADGTAVTILAGGRASRFPGKLTSDAGGVALLLRVYRNVRAIGPVYLSIDAPLDEALAHEMDCTIVPDRESGRGPLGGLVSTFARIEAPRCFVVAGDAPFAGSGVFAQLDAAWNDGVDAVVAESVGRIEPLCAIYRTQAFLEAARLELEMGPGAVRSVVQRLPHARVRIAQSVTASINTPADRDALLGVRS